jgi:hypothetical protein
MAELQCQCAALPLHQQLNSRGSPAVQGLHTAEPVPPSKCSSSHAFSCTKHHQAVVQQQCSDNLTAIEGCLTDPCHEYGCGCVGMERASAANMHTVHMHARMLHNVAATRFYLSSCN